MSSETASGLVAFALYFAGAVGYCVLFCAVYSRITPHREYDLIVREHNATAALAFGLALVGYGVALAGAIHNASNIVDFLVWGFVALVVQLIAYFLASLAHPGLSQAIQQNALAAGVWSGAVSLAAGIVSAACMSP